MSKDVFQLNLRTFDGEDEVVVNVDSDDWLANLEAEFEKETTTEPETKPEGEGDPVSTETTEPDPKPPIQTPEANRAFQELRRQADEGKRFADFVTSLASANDMTPEEYIAAIQEAQLEKEAKAKNIDPAVHKETVRVTSENESLKKTIAEQEFNNKIELARANLNLTPEQVSETFKEAFKQGLDPRVIPFEKLHELINLPTVITKAKAEAKQEYLNEQKKKQENFVPHSQSAGSPATINIDDAVNAYLKEMGDI